MIKKNKSFLLILFIVISLFFVAHFSLAAVDTGIDSVGEQISLGSNSPMKIITNIINFALSLLSLIAVIFILWAGFMWMTSGGNQDKISQAKKILINSAIGLLIVLSSWGIAFFVMNKLIDVTTGNVGNVSDNCTNGAVTSCGCGGSQTCNSGYWGPCLNSSCLPEVDDNISCDGKPEVSQCQADNDICGSDYLCDSDSCTCKPKASLGESCNISGGDGKCTADDSLCGPYLKCDPDSCVCLGPPVITDISPSGGFCNNDKNRGCNNNDDCLGGAICDLITPNGTENNFLTLYGYNFGTGSNSFETILTNIDFEEATSKEMPKDWTAGFSKNSSISMSVNEYRSGAKSILMHQDNNEEYPGKCNQKMCEEVDNCTWSATEKTCTFPKADATHVVAPSVYNENEVFSWPNTNRSMRAKLTYNLSELDFNIGDTYSIQFYYKGKTNNQINVNVGYNLDWTTQCASYNWYATLKDGYEFINNKLVPDLAEGENPCNPQYGAPCTEQANTCCVQAPAQKKCYRALTMTPINSGTYDNWSLYSYTFQYNEEMASWLTKNNKKSIEIGLYMNYKDTGDGTDLFIDDFAVTKIPDSGKVYFSGYESDQISNYPQLLNINCISSWNDNQVVIAIPSGAANGPIKIQREGYKNGELDLIDSTDNEVGPQIPDFVKNDITRPGLCAVTPNQGLSGDKVVYHGVNLQGGDAYFGSYTGSFKGIDSKFSTNDLTGESLAPAIVAGKTTTFVQNSASGISQNSNALLFLKEKEAEAGPYISEISPQTGSAGQYITIYGEGFGNVRGSNQILFDSIEASYDFPDVCLKSVWSNNQIIVKVPEGLENKKYFIKIKLGEKVINANEDQFFTYDSTASLKTSLCKISPVRGRVGDPISLWGEYFAVKNNSQAAVNFYRDKATSSVVIKDGKADRIDTFVETGAITGPVRVVKNGQWGNQINFGIGNCSSNQECGGDTPVCCSSNTYKAGSCSESNASCYFDIPNSVFEFKFNTGGANTSDINTNYDSCADLASIFGSCQTNSFCPNSPGKCSPFQKKIEVGSSCLFASQNQGTEDSLCGEFCQDNEDLCSYDKNKDICIINKECLPKTRVKYSLGDSEYFANLTCQQNLQGNFVETFVNVKTSCPDGYTTGTSGECYSDKACFDCPSNYSCQDNNSSFVCKSDKLCKNGYNCDDTFGSVNELLCVKPVDNNKTCDCCCEIGQSGRDCCAGLTCGGTCGSDQVDDGIGLGSCSGCAALGSDTITRDNACNCSDTQGKFCEVTDTAPGGICVDCAALDEDTCSEHSSQCCFNANKGVCEGGDGTKIEGGFCAYYDCKVDDPTTCNAKNIFSKIGRFKAYDDCQKTCADDPGDICSKQKDADTCSEISTCCFDDVAGKCFNAEEKTTLSVNEINYCARYNCTSGDSASCAVASTTGAYLSTSVCAKNCGAISSPGLSCAGINSDSCSFSSCAAPFSCLTNAGILGTNISDCGTCCCVPGDRNSEGLLCLADQGSCDGASRGLFCGCESDEQCGQETQGCSANTCCEGRPEISSTMPKNGDLGICRNSVINVKFNQLMDSDKLINNITLFELKNYSDGEYCESGTFVKGIDVYSSNKVIAYFQKVINNFKVLMGAPNLTALADDTDKLYCPTEINIVAEKIEENGKKYTSVNINPKKIMTANSDYIVVVKGDKLLDSSFGVMSVGQVGMNGALISPVKDYKFNNEEYQNSYIFGFKTLNDTNENKGICSIDKVEVEPESFLIKTSENDASDDNYNSINFDTSSDRDRLITARAYSKNGQELQSLNEYSWIWKWKINNTKIAYKIDNNSLSTSEFLVGAVDKVLDDSTEIEAKIAISQSSIISEGNGLSANSDMYIFICNNPWPAEKNNTWSPWMDKSVDGTSSQNYKFYYCRDAGEIGTQDDLPAISDDALTINHQTNLICSNGSGDCSKLNANDTCGTGVCVWSVLKESYFFRESLPRSGEITGATDTGMGGEINLNWYSPIDITKYYKIYYNLNNGKASANIVNASLDDCAVDNGKYVCSKNISGLLNDQDYSFKLAVVSEKEVESPLSQGVIIKASDTISPKTPQNLKASEDFSKIKFSWDANNDDTLFYRLYHGINTGRYGESFDSNTSYLEIDKSKYSFGNHYFAVSSVDSSGNESNKSLEIILKIQ